MSFRMQYFWSLLSWVPFKVMQDIVMWSSTKVLFFHLLCRLPNRMNHTASLIIIYQWRSKKALGMRDLQWIIYVLIFMELLNMLNNEISFFAGTHHSPRKYWWSSILQRALYFPKCHQSLHFFLLFIFLNLFSFMKFLRVSNCNPKQRHDVQKNGRQYPLLFYQLFCS